MFVKPFLSIKEKNPAPGIGAGFWQGVMIASGGRIMTRCGNLVKPTVATPLPFWSCLRVRLWRAG